VYASRGRERREAGPGWTHRSGECGRKTVAGVARIIFGAGLQIRAEGRLAAWDMVGQHEVLRG